MIRVVVVDDDFRIAGIHAAYVGKLDGFEVIAQVHTAAEAVAAVDRLGPDLLLLDLYLPYEHGLDLVARLRRDGCVLERHAAAAGRIPPAVTAGDGHQHRRRARPPRPRHLPGPLSAPVCRLARGG